MWLCRDIGLGYGYYLTQCLFFFSTFFFSGLTQKFRFSFLLQRLNVERRRRWQRHQQQHFNTSLRSWFFLLFYFAPPLLHYAFQFNAGNRVDESLIRGGNDCIMTPFLFFVVRRFFFFFVFSSSAHFKWNKLLFELPLEERIISFIEVCLWFRRCFFLFFIFDSSEWKLKAWVVRKHLYSIHLHLSCSSLLYRGIRWITHGAYMYAIPAAMLRLWF